MPTLRRLSGLEILDSRGQPTVKAICELASGARGAASVPSGRSTGRAEAHEKRDGDSRRYRGLGCREAVRNINEVIFPNLEDTTFSGQDDFDRALLELDGTDDKSGLGANALLGCSLAYARATAIEAGKPLFQTLASLMGTSPRLPRPTITLFSGGKHAGGQVEIQDVLIVPLAARTIDDAMAATFAVYQAAVALGARKYGMRPLVADEGGLAPAFPDINTMLSDAVEAITMAGFVPGLDIALAIDVAASRFFRGGRYQLGGMQLSGRNMIELVAGWVARFPIISVEDALAEDDWQHWPDLRRALGRRALIMGDDLLCTNPRRIERAVGERAANALLLKVNQIGTLTEAADSCRRARAAGWAVTASARSGETEDDWLADLATGWASDQIKIGSITRSERLAKYNRLLEIEVTARLPLAPWPTPLP